MDLSIYTITGEDTGRKVQLSDEIFGIEPNDHAIYLDVKQYLANQRQGTHKAKERGEISASTRKIKRQKGTGGARAGSIKSPLFRGGGRIFGPRPRNYSFKLNKKVKRLARLSSLSYKAKQQQLLVIEDFTFDAPKTKDYLKLLKNLNLTDKKTLMVLNNIDHNIIRSARNLQKTKVITPTGLITYNILNAQTVIFTESVIKNIQEPNEN